MPKNRRPLQVAPEFKEKLDKLQKLVMMSKGEKLSFREMTSKIVNNPLFNEIEKNILKSDDLKFDIKIKLDRRILND